MNLPEDIIYEIFRALPYPTQTHFARTCQLFWAIWKNKFAPRSQTIEETIYVNDSNSAEKGWIAKKYYLPGLSDVLYMIDGHNWQDIQNPKSATMNNKIKYSTKEDIFVCYRGDIYIFDFHNDFWEWQKVHGITYSPKLLIIDFQVGQMWVESQVKYVEFEKGQYWAIIEDGSTEDKILELAQILDLILQHIKLDERLDRAQKIIRAEQVLM